MGENTLSQLEALGNAVKRAGEIAEQNDQSQKDLQEVQKQLGVANSDLSFVKLEIETGSKKLAKVKNDAVEAEKIERAKLIEIQLKRDSAQKEYEDFLARTATERRQQEEKAQKIDKGLEKFAEAKKTNQNMIDEKKAYIVEAKKENAELETKRARVASDTGSFEKLAETMNQREASVTSREEGIKLQEQEVSQEKARLNDEKARLSAFEGSLATREANLAPLEAKLELKRQANDEKETHLIKYEESLKSKGYTPSVTPQAEETKAEEPVAGIKPKTKNKITKGKK